MRKPVEEVELKLIAGPSFDPDALLERLVAVGTLVDTPLEAMTRASDLPDRRIYTPLWLARAQMLHSALLHCSCTLQ